MNEPTHNEVVQQSVSTVMNEEKLDEIINLLKSTNKLLINLSEARATEAPAKEEQKTSHPGGMHSSKIFEVFITDLKDKVANEYLNDQQTLKDVYDVYYDTNGQMKNEVISPNGSFCCPITKEQKKTFLPLIKITVPKIFDKFKEDSEEEEYAVNESKEPELGEMNIPIDN